MDHGILNTPLRSRGNIDAQIDTPDRFDENWMEECSSGIHFFITRLEAENY